jgi:hypothetical protein
MRRSTFLAVTIAISILLIFLPRIGFCVTEPNTPLDVEGTDAEYRELLGMWKGYWGNSEQILLIHKINAGKVYFTHAWGDENKSAERMGEIRKDTDIYFFNYTTPGGQFSLSCKKGEAKMQGRRTISSSKMGSEVLGSFQKVK